MGCGVSKFCCGSEPERSNHGVTSSGKLNDRLLFSFLLLVVAAPNRGFDFCFSQVLVIG